MLNDNKDKKSIKMNDPNFCEFSVIYGEVYYCEYFSSLERCPVCNNGQCLKAIDQRYNLNGSVDTELELNWDYNGSKVIKRLTPEEKKEIEKILDETYMTKEEIKKTLDEADMAKEGLADTIKDSGNRTQFESGAVRDMHEGKGRFDLLPMCVLMRLAKHYEAGAKKYSDRNWEKGIPAHSFADSAMRHFVKYMDGWDDEDHLIAAIWNLCGLAWTEEKHPELIDIPAREKKEK